MHSGDHFFSELNILELTRSEISKVICVDFLLLYLEAQISYTLEFSVV